MEGMRTVRVSVPATTANLGPGFDCLGLALELRNTFVLSAAEWRPSPGELDLVVTAEGEGSRSLAKNEENLLCRAAQKVFARAGRYPSVLRLHIECRVPLGRGLGSSASAIVGGVWGAAALLGEAESTAELLTLAAELEGHPDNVLPAALGGFTVALPAAGVSGLRWVRAAVDEDLRAVVAVPSFSLRTSEARRRLPKQVPLGDAVFNVAHTAAFVASAMAGDWAKAAAAMEDRLHQPYRSPLVPGFSEVCEAAREAGAAGAALSGAGPSILALVVGEGGEGREAVADRVACAMKAAFQEAGVRAEALILAPAKQGVTLNVETP